MTCIAKFSFLALVVAIVVVPCRGDGEEFLDLSVMTYNIQAAIHMYPELSTEENLEALAQVIERDDPDILFAQEVMRFDPLVNNIDEFEWLRQRLGYANARYASGQEDPVPPGTAEWGVATYFREGSMVSSEKYRLESQGRTMLRVTASIHDTPVHLFNTHLGGNQPEQVAKVKNWLEDFTPLNAPIILGGDFNEEPDSDALAPLRSILDNVFEGSPEQPIDSFFVSQEVDSFDARVVPDPTRASDHDPSVFTARVHEVSPPAEAPPPLYGTKESFEGYALGFDDPDYLANWRTTGDNRFEVRNNNPSTGSQNLWVVDAENYRISYDLGPDIRAIDPTKSGINGTDDDRLGQQFDMWSKNGMDERKYASFFVELSKGDVPAPDDPAYNGPLLPVIAFGWTRGINGSTITPWFFDGMQWLDLGETNQGPGWNRLKTGIYSDTVDFTNLSFTDLPTDAWPRQYLGDFDTISLRSVNNDGKERAIDDILLYDGVLSGQTMPEPLQGDVNGDWQLDHLDVAPFIDHLLNGPYHLAADMNEDGALDGRDVAPFITAVQTGGSGTAIVPEPATFWLTAIGLLCVLWWRRVAG